MSDLTATNCGCNNNGVGGCISFGNYYWIILLLLFCNGNGNGCGILGGGNGCGNGCGIMGGNDNNSCEWLIWILLISCLCGNNNGCGNF